MRPPEPSPQQWFNRLPILPLTVIVDTYAIYTGVVNGIENLIVKLRPDGTLDLMLESQFHYWSFNYGNGDFESVYKFGSNWLASIISDSGRPYTVGSLINISSITMDMVSYKFSPNI